MFADGQTFKSLDTVHTFLDNLIVSLVLYLMAESYTLDDLVKLAISTQLDRIKGDELNLNSVDSLEKAGAVTDIVVNKGKVLTLGDMTV